MKIRNSSQQISELLKYTVILIDEGKLKDAQVAALSSLRKKDIRENHYILLHSFSIEL